MPAQEIIRSKRNGAALTPDEIQEFVDGITSKRWGDAQVGALAMAIVLNGMTTFETTALTRAMTRSGKMLQLASLGLPGPLLDKHSTGGVGDKVSLLLAPIVAACGGFVPMISGRGLGHTGGTLDKLDSIPGYQSTPDVAHMIQALQSVGCVVVGATAELAPADARLYAIRDNTATVESLPLITASILSKKMAAGLNGLVLDIKVGNGAFCIDRPQARALGQSLLEVAHTCELPAHAWITDMNQVLGTTCGNALEVIETVQFLKGTHRDVRLWEVTRTLCTELLLLGKLAKDRVEAEMQVDAALHSGAALEKFARMVHALGGPVDFIEHCTGYLPQAPVLLAVQAPRSGWIYSMQTRQLGLALHDLGAGRRFNNDSINPSTGFSQIRKVGASVQSGDPLALIHAADESSARRAADALLQCTQISDEPPQDSPVLVEHLKLLQGS
jgi:thymidine phosphorylase